MPDIAIRQNVLRAATRVVVKIGTNSVCDEHGRPDMRALADLARQVAQLRDRGVTFTLVASGAIGSGMAELGLPGRPKDMPSLQAAAAVGQGRLMGVFHDVFGSHGLKVAQVLLTRDDLDNRTRYLNIRNTLRALRELGAIPIINENDTVAVDEIRFGDNDILASLIAGVAEAQAVVLLSTIDGVLKDGKALSLIERVDEQTLALDSGQRSKHGSGGMKSKLLAAHAITKAGAAAVIANAKTPDVLLRVLAGERVGTLFVPAAHRISSRRSWIGQAARTTGRLVVDDGAARALKTQGKSLLPSGVTAVQGTFTKGANVAVLDTAGREIARGLTNYSAAQIDRIRGLKTSQIAKVLGDKPYDEIIHRNNMTLG